MRQPVAVLWDMDGTLVDTEPLWINAEYELARENGAIWTHEDALQLVGADLLDAGTFLREKLALTQTPAQIVDSLIERVTRDMKEQGLVWRPGARELVAAFGDRGIPQALVTMSYASIATPVAENLCLTTVVTGDDVDHGKPHPEPYLKAARLLGVDPADCLAVEDSVTGATSANAAGCFVVAVPNAVDVPAAPRRALLTTLAGQTPETLSELLDCHS